MSAKELKPCPFCGKQPHLSEDFDGTYSDYCVTCSNYDCPTQPYTDIFNYKDEAIDAWNSMVVTTNKTDYEKIAVYYS